MPELGEQMYCSQQICIPPTFPYVLRQFAKAAIRTQPNDLLKWSTTYFRCLSLNIPPPVKPRLEYPIPKDHHGMTPGWLRALLYQMAGSHTVTFKVLWDRWIGACLQHPNLIQILVLGGFEDNMAVPWLRFIGLCAAHLTDNLTQSMILICEILTEEPEGGSAMITIEIFLDLYQFLARIDAGIPQTLKNYYFLDKFLELFREKIAKDAGPGALEEESPEAGSSLASSETSLKTEKESRKGGAGSVVSCPSVTSEDPDNYMKLLMKIRDGGEAEEYFDEEQQEQQEPQEQQEQKDEAESRKESQAVSEEPKMSTASEAIDEDDFSLMQGSKPDEDLNTKKEPAVVVDKPFSQQLTEDLKMNIFPPQDDIISQDTRSTRQSSTVDNKEDLGKLVEDPYLLEDLERLRVVHQEMMGESDDEMEKFKASILAEAGVTPSQMDATQHFQEKTEDTSSNLSVKSDESSSTQSSKEKPPVEEREYEDVFVDAVPGIGAKVPEDLIAAVCIYMKEVAKVQHGMVMPRNIRHYECPPLAAYHD